MSRLAMQFLKLSSNEQSILISLSLTAIPQLQQRKEKSENAAFESEVL
jgi:hypothetical protein